VWQIESFEDWPEAGALPPKVITDLIEVPKWRNLRATIPPGTQLLSLTVKDGTTYVNFSKEFQTNH
jgi:spore germination protein GerM